MFCRIAPDHPYYRECPHASVAALIGTDGSQNPSVSGALCP